MVKNKTNDRPNPHNKLPPWERKLLSKIDVLRKDNSVFNESQKPLANQKVKKHAHRLITNKKNSQQYNDY